MSSIRPLICLLVLLAALLPQAVLSRPSYNYGIDRSKILKRRSSNIYAVTGVHTGNGPSRTLPVRQEIRQLEKDDTTWTLYLLGLDMMQNIKQTDMLSWYQIAGIHGRPYQAFDGVQAKPGNANNGYCMHSSILFPTWHRPYLALYEQVLSGLVNEIALQWPAGSARNKYSAAAANFRIPYWDWAAVPPDGESALPVSVGGSSTVTVSGPNGPQVIANPLFSYQFKATNSSDLPDSPFNVFTSTKRYPTTPLQASSSSQNDLLAQSLDNSALSYRNRLFNLFTNYPDYSSFSNDAWIPEHNAKDYDSIESVHDQIHGLTGGDNGHMSYIEYSAFDPIFFLHHAMVDRCFALWQVLHPKTYVVPEPATYNTFTNSAGQMQTSSSSLTPFYKDGKGNFWTSDSARSTQTFGYAYPETVNSAGGNTTAQVVSAINKLYGITPSKQKRDGTFKMIRDLGAQQREWIANIKVEKNALSEPFFIHVFIGPFDDSNPSSWSLEPNLAGSNFVFTKAAGTSNCQGCDQRQLVSATIPLTSSLMDNVAEGHLASMQPADVEPFLTSNFDYRITRLNNQEVAVAEVPSLNISIVSANITMPVVAYKLPKWGQMVTHMTVSPGV